MFKTKIPSLIFLLMFKVLNLEAHEVISEEDTARCVKALTTTDFPAALLMQTETTQTDLEHDRPNPPISTISQSNSSKNSEKTNHKHIFESEPQHKELLKKLIINASQSEEQKWHDLQRYHLQRRHTTTNLIETEEQMRMQGYSDEYIAGFDHAGASLGFAQSLRTRSINPHITHISEFADLIDRHIVFIEEGMRFQRYGDTADRLKLLEEFKSEARYRKALENVTYRWWFSFNLRLSILATPKEHRKFDYFGKWVTHDGLEDLYNTIASQEFDQYTSSNTLIVKSVKDLLDQFPERIMIPTIHKLGKISINNTYGTGVHLIGLNNEPKYADNEYLYPDNFFDHDIEHSIGRKIDNSQIPVHLQRKLRNLSRIHRELTETIFFEITHERFGMLTDSIKVIKGLIKDITKCRDLFIQLISEVHEELGLLDSRQREEEIQNQSPILIMPQFQTQLSL